jgi:uncharacterized protein (TIGR03663 family)
MRYRRDPTLWAVLGLTVVSLILRIVALGSRVAHWDEGRVAYWLLEYGDTGVLFYRPIVHGPLLKLVNAPLVDLLGATDFVIRLFPALVGAVLPATALLFRHRLRDETIVALSAFLALDPALLYYSRFMRSDILVAVFCFVAFACLVRAIDFDDWRYLPVAAFALAIGFGAKENALAYLVALPAPSGLLFGHRLLVAGVTDETLREVIERDADWIGSGIARHLGAIAGSDVLFFATITYVYAPRGRLPSQGLYYQSCGGYDPFFDVSSAVTLGEALANPLRVPRLVAFTVGSTAELYACQWISPRADDPNPYVEFFGGLAEITLQSSTALLALAVVGFLATVYNSDFPDGLPDDLVSFSFYWGAASMVGYPLLTDIGGAAWLVVHIVLPLSIPAAYAFGGLYRWGRDAQTDGDTVSVALVIALAVILVGSMAWTGYVTSFDDP